MRERLEYLGNQSYEEAISKTKAINKDTVKLDLSRNDLYLLEGKNFIGVLETLALKPQIKSLNIRGNGLHYLPIGVLIEAFSKIPSSIETLDISYNNFNEKGQEFANAVSALPPTIKKLLLIGNDFTSQTIRDIKTALPNPELSIIYQEEQSFGRLFTNVKPGCCMANDKESDHTMIV